MYPSAKVMITYFPELHRILYCGLQ